MTWYVLVHALGAGIVAKCGLMARSTNVAHRVVFPHRIQPHFCQSDSPQPISKCRRVHFQIDQLVYATLSSDKPSATLCLGDMVFTISQIRSF